jgi:hypothetical protein
MGSNYDSIKELLGVATGTTGAEDLSVLQGQLDKYNAAAVAMGEPTMTMDEWIAAGKPASP